ncbi:DUF2268 domain-containing putative Zn-dependent protease [Sphingosinicella sp. LHD-64]|uniref:gliding motility protein GldB-related protein n=1 Tax=Sphingosinicella sp. LHD-64 TaxID=3072139 RepID=UPI0028101BA5|nr:DUF2268 domain-containing putative Zn-dependent protease [Sphingosinicella sp. LHD-64]MDQ8757294.1 DUF2268 domain-containing putative Zn-dependent protease [Sphingosinicella sp. LHD-64]
MAFDTSIRAVAAALCALALSTLPGASAGQGGEVAAGPTIVVDDVYRFYELYDGAGGRPTAEQLQAYIDTGSPGLRHFAAARRTTGVRIAEAIAARPQVYEDARRCVAVLPRMRPRLDAALRELGRLYPEARFPPITVAIGRSRPMGIADASGVQVGLEVLCSIPYFDPNLEDRFVRVLAHEFVHSQQSPTLANATNQTVLQRSLEEGIAEFVTELITGDMSSAHLRRSVAGRETEVERAFLADKDNTDMSAWIDNGTFERPGDLGYWVGYRIAKAYYRNAPDKRRAVREMLQMTDHQAFFAASGWYPGIAL